MKNLLSKIFSDPFGNLSYKRIASALILIFCFIYALFFDALTHFDTVFITLMSVFSATLGLTSFDITSISKHKKDDNNNGTPTNGAN
jgi:hypothetical protein